MLPIYFAAMTAWKVFTPTVDSIFAQVRKIDRYGYPPTCGGGTTSKDIAKFEAKKKCENIFEDIFQVPMFEKWPEHTTIGEKLTHLWRLVDEEHFTDMKQPPSDTYDIYARIQKGQKLNFSEDGIKLASAWHVSKCSD